METDECLVSADLHENSAMDDPYQLNSQDRKDWHAKKYTTFHIVDPKKQSQSVAAETTDSLHRSRTACQD